MAATRIFRSIGLNPAFKDLKIPGITIVRTKDQAKAVLDILNNNPKRIHAWNAEKIIDDSKEHLPPNIQILCASAFIGPDINFGTGSKLFIDNHADANGLIKEFKEYFENPNYSIVWHDYGSHKHIFNKYKINILNLGGDTMDMARFANPSRAPHGYSLAWCKEQYLELITKIKKKLIKELKENPETLAAIEEYIASSKIIANKKYDEFIDSQKSPKIEELHMNPEYFEKFVDYSTLNAETIFYLRNALIDELSKVSLTSEGMKNLWDLYLNHSLPKEETLSDIEKNSMKHDAKIFNFQQAKTPSDASYPKLEQISPGCIWVPCRPDFNTNTYVPIYNLSSLSTNISSSEQGEEQSSKKKFTGQKVPWTEKEFQMLKDLVKEHGRSWVKISKKLNEAFHNSKNVRKNSTIAVLWDESFDPSIIKGNWTLDEDIKILKLKLELGGRWRFIARKLPGRSATLCKHRWDALIHRNNRYQNIGFSSMEEFARKIIEELENKKNQLKNKF